MKISHVITRLIVGGAQENTLASVVGLRRRPDFEVELVSGPATGAEGSLEAAARQYPGLLVPLPSLVRPIHPWLDLRALVELTRRFREHRPDVVHTHSGKAGFLGRLAARQAKVPVIVHTIHGPSFGAFQGTVSNTLFRAAEQVVGRFTNHFVTVSDAMRHQYLAAHIGQPQQYTRILSGFDLEPYLNSQPNPQLRARLGLAADRIVVGMIARLFQLKGHDDLIDAAPELVRQQPNLHFLLVGDGVWRARLMERTRQFGLARHFTFAGLVPPEEIPALVGVMDLLVHLSRREGLPRALPQALAGARPVIAYDCDGAGEICLEGRTGFLVRAGDSRRLIDRIVLLARDSELRNRLGHQGRSIVRELFPVERMVAELDGLYRRLAPRGPNRSLSHVVSV